MLQPAPTIRAADSHYGLASWHQVVVVEWRTFPSRERVVKLGEAIQLTAQDSSKVAVMVRVQPGLGIPPPEIRNALTRLLQESEDLTLGWAVVLEGDGFWAAAHRSFSATLQLLARSKSKMRIFKTVEQAAGWAGQLTDERPTDLVTLFGELARAAPRDRGPAKR